MQNHITTSFPAPPHRKPPKKSLGWRSFAAERFRQRQNPPGKGKRSTQTGAGARRLLPVNTRGCFCLSLAFPFRRRKKASCASMQHDAARLLTLRARRSR